MTEHWSSMYETLGFLSRTTLAGRDKNDEKVIFIVLLIFTVYIPLPNSFMDLLKD